MFRRNVRTGLCHDTENHSVNLHGTDNPKSYMLYAEVARLDGLFVLRFRRRAELWELSAAPASLQNRSMRTLAVRTIASSYRHALNLTRTGDVQIT
jgi:hypothetical protein